MFAFVELFVMIIQGIEEVTTAKITITVVHRHNIWVLVYASQIICLVSIVDKVMLFISWIYAQEVL